ncbi:MAG: polysaccharide biosynthesis protein [Hyphomicrobiaceae bacterium]
MSQDKVASRIIAARTWLVSQSRTAKRVTLMANDLVLLTLGVWLAFSLRLLAPYVPPNFSLALVLLSAPIAGVIVFHFLGLYRLVTRFIGHRGALRILGGTCLATLVWAVVILMAVGAGDREIWIPRSVIFLFPIIGSLLVWGSRQAAVHLLVTGLPGKVVLPNRARVLIYGAGGDGLQLLDALRNSPDHEAIGFLDDVPSLIGQQVGGLKVYRESKLGRFVERDGVKEVLLALPRRQRSERQDIIRRLARHPVRVKTMPALEDIATGRVSVTDLRAIDVDDLLARDPVPPDSELLARSIRGKSVMVTGAGGTIGSELVRQILRQGPGRLVLLELSEAALYEIETEVRDALARIDEFVDADGSATPSRPDVVAVLGSVDDARLLELTMRQHGVETIYHAAAYKHVPIVETNPIAGLKNNTFGTLVLSRMALRAGVERVVLVSTDKAVRPTNIMGASKRLAELVFQAAAARRSTTVFTMVRFGNVLDSSGSVVRRFRRQIQDGGPVTVTHRDVIRYFMSIPEAAALVIQAGAMAKGGEVFVLDMGEPVRIDDLARTMIRLAGLEVRDEDHPLGDIAIRYIGLRPGEKLFEELLLDEQRMTETEHPRIHQNKEPFLPAAELERELAKLEAAMQLENGSREAIQDILARTVEGYRPAHADKDAFGTSATWLPHTRTLH